MSGSQATVDGAREGQTFTGPGPFARWASFVKLPHTVFALPFALVGVTLASWTHAVTLAQVAWAVLAFTSARFAAMAFNRLVDRRYDALNPRTSEREIPRGVIGVGAARASVAAASALFVLSAWQLNPLCLALSPVALGWVLGYSYAKRFTRYAHLWLGAGLSIAPAGGWLAVTGAWPTPWWLLPLLAISVASWVAGFDVLYALPDAVFDRGQGLFSIPAAIGVPRAIVVARVLHALTVVAFTLVGLALPMAGAVAGLAWWAGVALAAVILLYEHSLVKADDLSKLDAAFFTMNGVLSMLFFGCVFAGRLLAGGRA